MCIILFVIDFKSAVISDENVHEPSGEFSSIKMYVFFVTELKPSQLNMLYMFLAELW